MTVQIATNRRGVPHATTLSRWAKAAFYSARTLYRTSQMVSLTIRVVGTEESRRLNRTWRSKDKPTNVLSFPGDPLPAAPRSAAHRTDPRNSSGEHALGDLAICAPVVLREAREQHKSVQSHWGHMVIHGVLHLLGYDHENERDAIEMEAREVEILSQFAYENPYV